MQDELVVDTNVLVHAQNPGEARCNDSRAFLTALLGAATHLCVDEGFACDESANRSVVGHEYLTWLRAGSPGLVVIVALAQSGRIRQVPKRAPQDVTKRIEQLIRKKRDRVFLSVAYAAAGRTLVSHDWEDFQAQKRAKLRREIGVCIVEAGDVLRTA